MVITLYVRMLYLTSGWEIKSALQHTSSIIWSSRITKEWYDRILQIAVFQGARERLAGWSKPTWPDMWIVEQMT